MVTVADLKNILLFRNLTAEEIGRITPFVSEKAYKHGVVLFREGMPGGILYLVKSGQIEIYTRKGDKEMRLAVLESGWFMGEMSLIDEEVRSASARALGETVLMILTRKSFSDILTTDPAVGNKILINLLKIMSQRLRENNRKLTNHV